MAVYLKLPDSMGDVKGEVTEHEHVDWIELTSFNWGARRNVEARVGAGTSRSIALPMCDDVNVSKRADKATIAIFKSSLAGKSGETEIHMTQTFGDATRTYLEYKLGECMISSYTIGGAEGQCDENLSLNFSKIECRYTPHDSQGNPEGPKTGYYDLVKGEVG